MSGFVNIHWHVSLCVSARAKLFVQRGGPLPSSPTIVVSVQTLERQPQLLLVLLQVFGELVEVQTPVFVLITGRHDFLQRGDKTKRFI